MCPKLCSDLLLQFGSEFLELLLQEPPHGLIPQGPLLGIIVVLVKVCHKLLLEILLERIGELPKQHQLLRLSFLLLLDLQRDLELRVHLINVDLELLGLLLELASECLGRVLQHHL